MTERAEQIRAERRRRSTAALAGQGRRLYVPPEVTENNDFSYRFFNDDPGRIEDFKRIGWEIVTDKRIATDDIGSGVAKFAGTHKDGSTRRAVLMRLPREFAEEDARAKARQIDAKEAAIKSNPDPEGGNASGMYVPGGKSSPTQISTDRK